MAMIYHDRGTRLRIESIVSRVSQQRWLEFYVDPEHDISSEPLATVARSDISKLIWALVRWLENTPPDAYPMGEREAGMPHEWRSSTWEPAQNGDGFMGYRQVSPAEVLLRDQLAGGKEVAYRELAYLARKAGINIRTLSRAARRMGVVSRRIGSRRQHGSIWSLPNNPPTDQPQC